MKLLHLKVFIAVWIVIFLAGYFVSDGLLEKNLYSTRVMNWLTFVWICSCFVAFWMGTFIERSLYINQAQVAASTNGSSLIPLEKMERMVSTFKVTFGIIAGVILIRVLWCIVKVGSLSGTFVYAVQQPNSFKFDIWQQASFHGMGAASDLIIASTIFAYALFGLMKKYKTQTADSKGFGYSSENLETLYRTSVRILMLSIFALTLYSMLSNERVALVAGFLGGGIAYFLTLRRFPIKNLIYLTLFLLVIWVVVEGARRQYFGTESFAFILEYAKNRLFLYLVSGLRNVDTMVNYIPNHTYGLYSFNFLLIPFKLDVFYANMQSQYGHTAFTIIPGFGVIPVFGTAYSDFGPAGVLYFVAMGFIYQRLHRKALLENNFLATQIYAFSLVALIISFMPYLPILPRFWVNVLTLVIINKSVQFGFTTKFLYSKKYVLKH